MILAKKARELNNALKEYKKLEKMIEKKLATAFDLVKQQGLEEQYQQQMNELIKKSNLMVEKIQDWGNECELLVSQGALEKI
jgi:hypothetical protein